MLSVVDYDAVRAASASVFATKLGDVRAMIAKMQKAQRLAEKSLDSCDIRNQFALALPPRRAEGTRKSVALPHDDGHSTAFDDICGAQRLA